MIFSYEFRNGRDGSAVKNTCNFSWEAGFRSQQIHQQVHNRLQVQLQRKLICTHTLQSHRNIYLLFFPFWKKNKNLHGQYDGSTNKSSCTDNRSRLHIWNLWWKGRVSSQKLSPISIPGCPHSLITPLYTHINFTLPKLKKVIIQF